MFGPHPVRNNCNFPATEGGLDQLHHPLGQDHCPTLHTQQRFSLSTRCYLRLLFPALVAGRLQRAARVQAPPPCILPPKRCPQMVTSV